MKTVAKISISISHVIGIKAIDEIQMESQVLFDKNQKRDFSRAFEV